MTIVGDALGVILERYDSPEYLTTIQNTQNNDVKFYGAIDKPHIHAIIDWVQKIWTGAPDALVIAAAGHDWERAFEGVRDKLEHHYPYENGKPIPEWYNLHKRLHSANSVQLLRSHLGNIVPDTMMQDISYLVFNHEFGGERNTNGALEELHDMHTVTYNLNHAADILKQADSLAYFNVLDIYVDWRIPEKIRQKIRFMYNRVKDPLIRKMIQEMTFEKDLANKLFQEVLNE